MGSPMALWLHKTLCFSVGSLSAAEGTAPAMAPAAAQGRCFCHVTAVKNEICTSGTRQTHSSAVWCHRLSLTHLSDSLGCACAYNRRIILGYREIAPSSVGEDHRE